MSSVTLTQQGIQRTVKHFKAFFISEKPIFLSKTLIFNLIIEYQNQHMDSGMFYLSNLTGLTGNRNLHLSIASHLRSKVLLKSIVVHRYRLCLFRSIWAILWAYRNTSIHHLYPSDNCVRRNRYFIGTRNLTAYRVIRIQPTA